MPLLLLIGQIPESGPVHLLLELVPIVFFGTIGILYWLPSMLAFDRRHRYRWVILWVNGPLGWTIIGWLIALIWALSRRQATDQLPPAQTG